MKTLLTLAVLAATFSFQNCSVPEASISQASVLNAAAGSGSSAAHAGSAPAPNPTPSPAPTSPSLTAAEKLMVDRWLSNLNTWHGQIFNAKSTNWGGTHAWGTSYILDGILDVYSRSKDPRFLDWFVKYADDVFATREDVVQQTSSGCRYSDVKARAPVWTRFVTTADQNFKQQCWSTSAVYTGMILAPIARFAKLIETEGFSEIYMNKAGSYAAKIEQSLKYHEETDQSTYFYTFSGDGQFYGYSKMCAPCGAAEINESWIGMMAPLNMIAAVGRVYVELSYRSELYKRKAEAFSRTVKDLIDRTGGGATWHYWPAYESRIDDSSHGALVANFVAKAVESNIVYTKESAYKISYNFLSKIVLYQDGKAAHLSTYVDGSNYESQYMDAACGLWANLSEVDSRTVEACKSICGWNESRLSCDRDTYVYKLTESSLIRWTKEKVPN